MQDPCAWWEQCPHSTTQDSCLYSLRHACFTACLHAVPESDRVRGYFFLVISANLSKSHDSHNFLGQHRSTFMHFPSSHAPTLEVTGRCLPVFTKKHVLAPRRRHALPGARPFLRPGDSPLPRGPRGGRRAALGPSLRPAGRRWRRRAGRRAALRRLPKRRRRVEFWRCHVRVWPRRPWGPPHSRLQGQLRWILGLKFCFSFAAWTSSFVMRRCRKDNLIQKG